MTLLKAFAAVALAGYFTWVVVTALIRRRTPDFGRDIYRSEQPGKYWLQITLYSLMAAGAAIYSLALIAELSRS